MRDFDAIIQQGRDFMKCSYDDDFESDQDQKKPQPPLVKAAVSGEQIALPTNFRDLKLNNDILSVITNRESHRVYTKEKMTLLELSFLLYSTQGIKSIRGKSYATLRTVPCGGARHEFETYLLVSNVDGLKNGAYHFLPMTDELEFLRAIDDIPTAVTDSLDGQNWAAKANVVFYWSIVPYRAEWRYGIYAHRIALVDLGHIGQNLYIACEAVGLGTCAVGAFSTELSSELFGLDGNDEFIVYAAPVGKVKPSDKEKELEFYAFLKEENL